MIALNRPPSSVLCLLPSVIRTCPHQCPTPCGILPVFTLIPPMHATLFEATRHGFTGGTLTLEALILAKTLKLLVLSAFLWAIWREIRDLLG